MNYRRLGRSGLKVSVIGLGSMQFGWTAAADQSFTILDFAVEQGCNFIDTADIYSSWADSSHPGKSESILGDWLTQSGIERHKLVLATKVRGSMSTAVTDQGLSRQHIRHSVYRSLDRLQTDYIDLYQLHWPDQETPLEETLQALTDLVREGVVHYIGCSNFPAWLLMKSLWVSEIRQLESFKSIQPHYNLMHRAEYERELQAACLDQGVGAIPYSPMAGGFLTGKYRPGAPQPVSARADRILTRYGNEQGYATLDRLDQISAEVEANVAEVSLAWLLAQPTVSSVILGANSVDQLRDTMTAFRVELSEAQLEQLDQVSAWSD